MADTALVLFAKEPRPGTVKTRLTPPLTPNQAAELSRCFVEDTADLVRPLPDIDRFIAYDPPDALPYFMELAGNEFTLVSQPAGDLGRRLSMVFSELIDRGYERVLAIGSDAPTMPVHHISQAIELLHDVNTPVVIGPSSDGGYCLIGTRGYHPALFEQIQWSTGQVTADTLRQAEQQGVTVGQLPVWYDVDDAETLTRLVRDLENAAANKLPVPQRTHAYLQHNPFQD